MPKICSEDDSQELCWPARLPFAKAVTFMNSLFAKHDRLIAF